MTVLKEAAPKRTWFYMDDDLRYRFKKRLAKEAREKGKANISQQQKMIELITEYVRS